ncbi:MAG: translation initiation factor IF-2, partial [Terriglobia bacterium]
MKKIRINELARELEVKAHEILDRLPELGVTEKKTHSSSIDEDVAIKLRRLYGLEGPVESEGELEPEPAEALLAPEAAEPIAPVASPEEVPAPIPPAAQEPEQPRFAAEETRPAAPIRPPLASGRP